MRCIARTKKNKRCKKYSGSLGGHCWVHTKFPPEITKEPKEVKHEIPKPKSPDAPLPAIHNTFSGKIMNFKQAKNLIFVHGLGNNDSDDTKEKAIEILRSIIKTSGLRCREEKKHAIPENVTDTWLWNAALQQSKPTPHIVEDEISVHDKEWLQTNLETLPTSLAKLDHSYELMSRKIKFIDNMKFHFHNSELRNRGVYFMEEKHGENYYTTRISIEYEFNTKNIWAQCGKFVPNGQFLYRKGGEWIAYGILDPIACKRIRLTKKSPISKRDVEDLLKGSPDLRHVKVIQE
jgi:tRNA nucleotidyltransferase/poly(A) polymerase